MGNPKTAQSKSECRQQLSTELDKCAERLKELESGQLAGDFSIEMSRKISVLRYHIEVTENRLNGLFEASYQTDFVFNVPKAEKK